MPASVGLPIVALVAGLGAVEAHASPKIDNVRIVPAAQASCMAARPMALSRTILGGAPSALDAIRASQGGGSTQNVVPVALAGGRRKLLEPASQAAVGGQWPQVASAGDCVAELQAVKTAVRITAPDFGALAAELDPDAELGTQPIAVQRTRFDDRWNRVRQAPPASLMHTQLARAQVHSGLGERDKLQRVNNFVNAQIAYVADDRNYGQRDLWATAGQTIARGKGDCEDFAILKMHMLRAAGVDPKRMKLVLLRDLAANADHAFLLVDTAEGKLVLDNLTDRLYDGHRAQSVRPVLSFSENRRWVHAYRGVEPAQDLIARPAARRTFAVAINNQRSVSADPLTFKTGLSK